MNWQFKKLIAFIHFFIGSVWKHGAIPIADLTETAEETRTMAVIHASAS